MRTSVVARHGNALAAFRDVIERADPGQAMKASAEMERVGLRDALELCRVLAHAQDPRYDSAAWRWLMLLASEEGKTLGDLQVAAAALGALRAEPEAEKAWAAVTTLIRAD